MPAKSSLKYFFIPVAIVILTACTNFPKDPENSFDNARINGLKVGIAVHPPFTIIQNGHLSGTEVKLIEHFAQQNGFNINYTVGTESELISQLEKYQLHLIAGGFDKKTVWIKKAGLSAAYDSKHVLMVAKGENKLLYKLEQYIFKMKQ